MSLPESIDSFATAGHDVLFAREDDAEREACDVCGETVADDAETDETSAPHDLPGRGLYVWVRGDVVRREEPRLCPSCAAALGLSALARWETEEEEG